MSILIFIFLIPLLISLVMRMLLPSSTPKLTDLKSQISGAKLIEELTAKEIKAVEGKTIQWSENQLSAPKEVLDSLEISDHAKLYEHLALIALGDGGGNWVLRHRSLIAFDNFFAPFALIALLFGFLAKSLPPNIIILLAALTLCVSALNSLYLFWVRHMAFRLLTLRLKSISFYLRANTEDRISDYLSSLKSRYILPRIIRWAF